MQKKYYELFIISIHDKSQFNIIALPQLVNKSTEPVLQILTKKSRHLLVHDSFRIILYIITAIVTIKKKQKEKK